MVFLSDQMMWVLPQLHLTKSILNVVSSVIVIFTFILYKRIYLLKRKDRLLVGLSWSIMVHRK